MWSGAHCLFSVFKVLYNVMCTTCISHEQQCTTCWMIQLQMLVCSMGNVYQLHEFTQTLAVTEQSAETRIVFLLVLLVCTLLDVLASLSLNAICRRFSTQHSSQLGSHVTDSFRRLAPTETTGLLGERCKNTTYACACVSEEQSLLARM